MSNSNSDNSKIGKVFQEKVQSWFAEKRNENFVLEYPVHIGKPARPHNFDVANESFYFGVYDSVYFVFRRSWMK
jgi:hypothetical protein